MAKETGSSSISTFQKLFIAVLSGGMLSLGAAFIAMQNNIVALQVQQVNLMKQIEYHISEDKILKTADVLAVVRDFKVKE